MPLLFEHSTKAIGEIDPDSVRSISEGLVVRGHVDQSTDEGEQAWRQIKGNTASFSIGGVFESRPRKGAKGREIYSVDLLEISATSTPAHGATRVLDWKSTERRYGLPDGSVTDYEGLLSYTVARSELETKKAHPIRIASFKC